MLATILSIDSIVFNIPLWNFSSMGGTILYTFDKSSLRVSWEAMISDLSIDRQIG